MTILSDFGRLVLALTAALMLSASVNADVELPDDWPSPPTTERPMESAGSSADDPGSDMMIIAGVAVAGVLAYKYLIEPSLIDGMQMSDEEFRRRQLTLPLDGWTDSNRNLVGLRYNINF